MKEQSSKLSDFSNVNDFAYKVAVVLKEGNYQNVLYYEFHEPLDPDKIWNVWEGLEAFIERSQPFYSVFLSEGLVDDFPAVIHVAVRLGDEWLIARDCGYNFYGGYGPTGILKLREACSKQSVLAFKITEPIDSWIAGRFSKAPTKSDKTKSDGETEQFKKLLNAIRFFRESLQDAPQTYQELKEEDIRDRLLVNLRGAFNGLAFAETKNGKGKTDILVRSRDGKQSHIFELKVWNGTKVLKATIDQLNSYLSWHHRHAGIIFFSDKKSLTSVLLTADSYMKKHFKSFEYQRLEECELIVQLPMARDFKKTVETHIFFINLYDGLPKTTKGLKSGSPKRPNE